MKIKRLTVTQRLAIKLRDGYATQYAEYLAECAAYRRDGFRPQYCEHGTYQWTDYDNICGGCEDGDTMGDGLRRSTRALAEAKARTGDATRIINAAAVLDRRPATVSALDHDAINAKILDLLDQDPALADMLRVEASAERGAQARADEARRIMAAVDTLGEWCQTAHAVEYAIVHAQLLELLGNDPERVQAVSWRTAAYRSDLRKRVAQTRLVG